MITIKDLEDKCKWLTPEERQAEALRHGDHGPELHPHAHEFRLHLQLEVVQYLDERAFQLKNIEQVRKEIVYKTKMMALRKLYRGVHDRHQRIMELKDFVAYHASLAPLQLIEERFSPITEILDIAHGKA